LRNATALVALRKDVGAQTGEKPPGVLAFVARFVVAGLTRFPEINATIDVNHDEIVEYDGVGLGIAAQTDRGLVVPVVPDAHRLSIRGLDAEIRRLASAARDGALTAADLRGGTFTLNNYGVFGVDGSAAIINHPEAGILGVGRIIDRPWMVDGDVEARKIVQLSLAFDHRVCDGGTAAGLLRFVADCIERPTLAFADL
jgi:2-oxoisovalerate dehydrogenase E2 component (dihydrolipoyl transacylase)